MGVRPVVLEPWAGEFAAALVPEPVVLPPDVQRAVDRHFHTLSETNPHVFNGPVYTIVESHRTPERWTFRLARTSYAHYLFTIHHRLPAPYACRVLYAAGLVRTTDRHWILGEMAPHTTHAGRLQCVGGGLDSRDLRADSFDLASSLRRETGEELGLAASADPVPAYLKTGGPYDFVTAIYRIEAGLSRSHLLSLYAEWSRQGDRAGSPPEFSRLVALPSSRAAVRRFLDDDPRPRVDYLDPLLRAESRRLPLS